MRKHQEAAEVVLATLDSPNAVLAENLLGLARGWDQIERAGEGILHELGVDADGDIWDELVKELNAG